MMYKKKTLSAAREGCSSRSCTLLIFPIDAGNRAGVNGVLDLFLGSAILIVHFRQIVVVHLEYIRTAVDACTAANAFILIYHH